MSLFDTENQSVFDEDVKDQISERLYTKEWSIYGSNDSGKCQHTEFSNDAFCPVCSTWEDRSGGYFYMGYVWSSTLVTSVRSDRDCLPLFFPLKEGGECCTIELVPPSLETLGKYYPYFSKYALTDSRGEMFVNFCRKEYKSPCVDINNCIVASCTGEVEDNIAVVHKRDQVWGLFIPNNAMMNICELLADHDVYPVPGAHDSLSYNSARIIVAGTVKTRVMKEVEWDTTSQCKSMSRFVKCDAVATATFTVSVVLRPYLSSKGKFSKYKYMNVVVHNIR